MRILQVCNKIPFPPTDGGTIAMNNLTQGFLNSGHTVKVIAISTPKQNHPVTPEYKTKTNFESIFIDTSVKPVAALTNLFTTESYNISRFYSNEFNVRLKKVLQENTFDIIQLESLFVAPYLSTIRQYSRAKVVLRAHNVEYKIWERLAEKEGFFPKKAYLSLLAKRLKKYEVQHLNSFDGIAAISDIDRNQFEQLGCQIPAISIPFGIETNGNSDNFILEDNPSAFHLGSMDWAPNTEGVLWFLKNVWPEISRKFPDKKLYLAGKRMPLSFFKFNCPSIVIEGEVPETTSYMHSKSIMIVPLLAGGGMRVKIIEGMAMGKTVISTTIGAEGIACEHKKNILISDTPEEFKDALELCYTNKETLINIGKEAKKLVKEKYDNNRVTQKLLTFYKDLLN